MSTIDADLSVDFCPTNHSASLTENAYLPKAAQLERPMTQGRCWVERNKVRTHGSKKREVRKPPSFYSKNVLATLKAKKPFPKVPTCNYHGISPIGSENRYGRWLT